MSATIAIWTSDSLEQSAISMIDRASQLDDVVHIAVLPDAHAANDVCVGTAMATRHLIYPSAVGGDIGCGMLALAFNVEAEALSDGQRAGEILRAFAERIPCSRRSRRNRLQMPQDLNAFMSHDQLNAVAREEGVLQFGTLGSGNHFVELQADEDDRLWLMLHTGSRAIGQAVRAHHVARCADGKLPHLDARTDAGVAYLEDAAWAGRFARANRDAIATQVIDVLKQTLNAVPIESTRIECDHNHVRRELHFDQLLYVHRKGAIRAESDDFGVVPGSMGTLSYHVCGRGHASSLKSSAHGAGRRFSRAEARARFTSADLKHQMRRVWFDPRQSANLRDESPHAYKDVRRVMRAQRDLVEVTRTLRPVLVYKGAR
jgi:tRNA-splicing ligase RtcB